jgi:[pyruvate, water dikinase]-phosphate phosphotransferase / [pyruvate, water dikinase] kinase
MDQINLHLLSDSTGETLGSISRAVLSQFKGIKVNEYMWSMIRTETRMKEAIEKIKQEPGIVIYTILDEILMEKLLEQTKKEKKIVTISALEHITEIFSQYLGKGTINRPGRQHKLDEDYFKRIAAINFTIDHDDGKKTKELDQAEVILVGPSRTSKSPTCVYLSHRGIKAANVPFINGVEMPKILFELQKPLIIGLTINSEKLVQIRKTRINQHNQPANRENEYIDIEEVEEELRAAKKLYSQQGWPIIEVSKRSIEETASVIMQKLNKQENETY